MRASEVYEKTTTWTVLMTLASNPFFLLSQVNADNVGSLQMQQIRASLRGRAEVLMGKNTMMRKAIRGMLDKHPELERILPCVVGNVGFVFTSGRLDS